MSHAAPPPPPTTPPPAGPPHYGPPPHFAPAEPKRSRALVWVLVAVLALVVVGAAATLLVVAPWDDDASGSTATDGAPGSDDAADGPADDPADDPADPPADADVVTGDLDGDGLGDAQFVLSQNYGEVSERWTFTSTGSSFAPAAEADDQDVYGQVSADWDGDGVPSALTILAPADNDDSISFTLAGDGIEEQDVELPAGSGIGKHLVGAVGDFDGDGRPDLALSTATAACEVTVSVLLGTGGGFGDPAPWAVLTGTLTLETRLTPADVDGDGDTDLLGAVPAETISAESCESGFWAGDYAGIVLTSNGSGFDTGAETDVNGEDLRAVVGGDFSGDGTPMIAIATYGTELRMLEHDGSGLTDAPAWTVDVGPAIEAATSGDGTRDLGVEAVTVADVDGDGDDDLVVLAHDERADLFYTGVWVLRSEGAGFAEPEKWANASDCGEFDSCSADPVTGSVLD